MVAKQRVQVLTIGRDADRRSELRAEIERNGHDVVEADSLDAGLHRLARLKIACVVAVIDADAVLADVVARLLRCEPSAAVVLLTPHPDVDAAVTSMRLGAADYLRAELTPVEVALAVGRALEWREARVHERVVAQTLTEEVGRLTGELRGERGRRDQVALAALESLVYVVEAKDLWLAGHSVRVAQMAASLAAELSHTDEEIEQIRTAGRLHDIGMVGVSERILSKEGSLTVEEFAQVRAHVTLGSLILSPLPGLGPVVSFVRHHHERQDGQGYPDGLAGNAIPWGARVIGIAEIYDAFTTVRPYREPMAPEQAVTHMKGLVGSAIGEAEWHALGAVVARREALVFLVDHAAQAAPGARASALHL
jgi:putative two-component system response regulator